MRSSAICLLASAAGLSAAAALPRSDNVVARPRQEESSSGDDTNILDVIVSSIPLDSLHTFTALTLEQVAENPDLIDPEAIVEGIKDGIDTISAGFDDIKASVSTLSTTDSYEAESYEAESYEAESYEAESYEAESPETDSTDVAPEPEVKPAVAAQSVVNGTSPAGPWSNTTTPSVDNSTATAVNNNTLTEGTCTSPSTRIEWRSYSNEDRSAFLDSIVCLMNLPSAGSAYAPSTSRYEDFVKTHQVLTPQIHNSGVFMPWHRYFLHVFEQALRSECGFDRSMPWWDETLDTGRFMNSSIFSADYFGSLPGPTGGSGTCVLDGRFANLTCHIGPGTSDVEHCLSRAGDEELTSQSSTAYVQYCAQQTVFGKFASCAESGPHAWAHLGIGSLMADAYSSASDPTFYMHHLFVDNEWASWQEVNSTRKSDISGACIGSNNPCTSMMPETVLSMNGLADDVTVADVVDTQGPLTCYKYDYYVQ